MPFPTELTNAVDNVTEILAAHLNNLEAKVGINASTVITSLDYLLKNTASINPGHKHSKLWPSAGNSEAVSVDAAGNVSIGAGGYTTMFLSNQNVSALNPGTSTFANLIQGPGNTHLIIDLRNNDANDAIAFRYSAANNGIVDTIGFVMKGNGNVGIGTNSPNAAALLHLSSTTKGFLPPVMTTAQKNAISNPPAGLVIYDSTLNKLCVRSAAAWETIVSA